MYNQINISNIKINGMGQNANINIGKTVQNSHTSNFKLYGANFSTGDCSPSCSNINSGRVLDQDISDQGQIDNPSYPSLDEGSGRKRTTGKRKKDS